jgi:hypothetical protein
MLHLFFISHPGNRNAAVQRVFPVVDQATLVIDLYYDSEARRTKAISPREGERKHGADNRN